MKKITYLLLFMLFSLIGLAQTVTIGSGTNVGNKYPVVPYYNYSYSQQIVLQSEIALSGNITKLRFYSNGTALTTSSNNWTIYMGHTPKTNFSSNTDWILAGAMTQVFSGLVNASPAAGWMEITLTTPFAYNNVDNLVVSVDENAANYTSGSTANYFRIWTTPTSNRGVYYQNDTTNPDPTNITLTGTRTSYISQMQVVFPSTTPPSCAINHVPADLTTDVARNPTLSWADGGGGPTSYDVYFGTTSNPALIGNQSGTTYIPTAPLAANTDYFWKIVPKNANGDAIGCIERSFTTGTSFNYCAPTYSSGAGTTDGITNVTLGSLNNTSTQNNVSPYYTFFNAVTIPDISQATSANVSITFGSDGNQYSAVWIDFNHDGNFDASEGFIGANNTSGGTTATTINITVPAGAILGNTRMRVRGGNDSALTTAQACGASSSGFGETEDYIVNITLPPACNVPTALSVTGITTTTANVSWAAAIPAPAVGYQYAITASATPPASGTAITGISDSFTGLTANTTYYLHVRSECTAGSEYSNWVTGSSFMTSKIEPTNQITNLVVGTVTATAIPLAWTAAVADSQLPDGYLVKASSVDLVSILDPVDGTDPSNVTAFTANAANKKQTTGTATSTTSFTSMTPGSMYYYKVYSYTNTGSSIDFKTDSPATLFHATKPNTVSTTLTAVNLTTTSIGFDWSSTAFLPVSNEYLIFAKVGSAVTTGTPTLNPSTYTADAVFGNGTAYEADASAFCVYKGDGTSVNITGLNPSTTYYFTIYAVVENPNSNATFTYSTATSVNRATLCTSTTVPTVNETFESVSSGIPLCWAINLISGTTNWDISNGSSGDISGAYAGTNFMEKDYSTSDAVLISMPIDFGLVTSATRINTYLHRHASAHTNDQYKIYVNTSPSLTGATQIFSLYSKTTTVPAVAATGWYNYLIDIPKSFNGQSTIYIIFEGITTAGFSSYDLGIDDFKVEFTPSCIAPSALTVSAITSSTAALNWSASSSNPANGYDYYYSTVNTAPTTTTSGSVGFGVTTANITGLASQTQYFYWVRANCGTGDTSVWTSGGSFTTTQIPATLPYTQDFNVANDFDLVNGSQVNIWAYGSATGNTGNSLYISNDGGINNDYNVAVTSVVQAYRDIAIPNGTSLVNFSFDWKANGESCCDYLRVWIVPTSFTPTAGTQIGTAAGRIQVGGNLNAVTAWQTYTNATLDLSSFANTTMRLVFEWKNDGSLGAQNAAAIDNISIVLPPCPQTAIWNGTAWSGDAPSATAKLVFNGNYTHTTTTTLEGCSCAINGTSVVTFNDGALNLQNELTTAVGTSLLLESGASLVQVNTTVPNDVQGIFTAKRNSSPIVRLDYTAWSSPVVGQNALAFSPATVTNRFYEYDPNANVYSGIDPVATNFTAGKGLLVRAPNNWSATVYSAYPGEFSGVPNNGNVNPLIGVGYNLIGNPYASPISATNLLSNTNNNGLGITTLYFWTHKHPATGSTYGTNNYASYNSVGGTPANVGEVVPDGIIQVGQGFLVNATAAGSAEMNNAMRLTTSNGQFFKTSGEVQQSTTIEKHRMWFGLTSPTDNHNVALVGYVQGATNAIDNSFDAKLFEQTNSVLYSNINNDKYVIQGRALPFNALDVVSLGLVAQTAGSYTITMTNFDGLFTPQDVFLRDNLLNVTHDIKGSAYTFVTNAGQYDARFEIVYAAPLAVETPVFTENSVVVYTNDLGVTINAGQTIIDNVKVFDVRGRLLVSKSNVNASSIVLENVTSEKQVLLVQITSLDNVTVFKKVIN